MHMAMKRKKDARRLKVALVGKASANALELLETQVKVPSDLCAFPNYRGNPQLLKELADTDVVVTNLFSESMARAARNLKLLQAPNAGLDTLRLDLLSRQTTVANAYFHGPAVAEYVVMMILVLSRDLLNLEANFRKGVWRDSWMQGLAPRDEVLGKTLGLVGFGHIGKEVAVRAKALGMKISVISAHPAKKLPSGVQSWNRPDSLNRLLKESDFVVLACPLNSHTRDLLGPEELGLMKRSAFLINVARSGVVKEEALYRALKERRIAGAAIDVWYHYPRDERPRMPSDLPFHELDNLVMTPHVSGWMRGTRERRFQLVAENISRLAAGKPLLNVVQGPPKHGPPN